MSKATITLAVDGYDDCDQATLLGILRHALLGTERGRDFIESRGPIVATTTGVWGDSYTTEVAP